MTVGLERKGSRFATGAKEGGAPKRIARGGTCGEPESPYALAASGAPGDYLRAILSAELGEGTAERSAGNVNETGVGSVQLQDQERGGGNGEGGDEQTREHSGIGRGKEAEADEDGGEPEHQDDE